MLEIIVEGEVGVVGCVGAAGLDTCLLGFGLVLARCDLVALLMGCTSGPCAVLAVDLVGDAKLTCK